MSKKNKIPNSDIIGYEGPVGQEKSIHKTHWTMGEKTWKSDPNKSMFVKVKIGPGKYKFVKRSEVKDE